MSGNERAYQLGATALVVGLSSTITVNPQANQLYGFFKIRGGAGTLAIVQGASSISTDGYYVGATEVVELQGPAKFYLAAAGATMTVGYVLRYSAGISSTTPPY